MVKSGMNATDNASIAEYHNRVARCQTFVRDHIKDDLQLDDLASVACFSKFHFHRVFTALVGETPADYVKRLRLERSANLLVSKPSLDMTDVAMECGFSTPSVFAREFRMAFGMPPSRYRSAGRVLATDPADGTFPGARVAPARDSSNDGDEPAALRRLGPFVLATVMHTGGYGPGIGRAWGRLFAWAMQRDLVPAVPGGTESANALRTAGIPWDNPDITPPAKCRYSACLVVPPDTQSSADVSILSVPERIYLVASYRGPESGLSAAYRNLFRRDLVRSGFEPEDAPAIEFYRAEPGRGRDPHFDLEIAVPVVPLA